MYNINPTNLAKDLSKHYPTVGLKKKYIILIKKLAILKFSF